MILTYRQIREGEMIPRFYGVAWHDFLHFYYICYPYPFNIILAFLRKYWLKVRYYRIENPLEQQALRKLYESEDEIREKAYESGYRCGLNDGNQVRADELREARKQGARDVMNAFSKEFNIDSVGDDWNPYKDEQSEKS
jgi:hypothetical protein